MFKNLEKIAINWIFPLMIILSFFIFESFNYYFLVFSAVIYLWRNLPIGIIINIAYLIITILTDVSPVTTINLLIITVLIFISKNSPYMKVISYVFAMAIFISFMSQINFIISIITMVGVLLFSYLKEKRKIFLFLLIPVIALSFFNENLLVYESLNIQQIEKEETSEKEKIIFEEENNTDRAKDNEEKVKNEERNQNNSFSSQVNETSNQGAQDLFIYQSFILLIALFILIWIFFYHKMYENKKVFIYSAITIFFIILSIFAILALDFKDLKPYNSETGTGLTQEDINNNVIYRTIINKYKEQNNLKNYENMTFEEQNSALKTIERIVRYYLIITIIILLILAFFIIKSKRAKSMKKKDKKTIQKEKKNIYNKKGIYLLDEGYKFIRNNFYFQYSYLTPYELLETVPVSSEFKKLTELFVKKEYGSKEISVPDAKIKKLIDEIIENLHNS